MESATTPTVHSIENPTTLHSQSADMEPKVSTQSSNSHHSEESRLIHSNSEDLVPDSDAIDMFKNLPEKRGSEDNSVITGTNDDSLVPVTEVTPKVPLDTMNSSLTYSQNDKYNNLPEGTGDKENILQSQEVEKDNENNENQLNEQLTDFYDKDTDEDQFNTTNDTSPDNEQQQQERQMEQEGAINEDEDITEESKGGFMFKKKDVKPRTQSFQSVLSTASLKSLNQPIRNNSIISTVSNNNTKNFQSFIQAPVLSSVSKLKNQEVEIGRQLPFNHHKDQNKSTISSTSDKDFNNNDDDDDFDDHDTILQQQRLTLNALKKLSLSPIPKIDSDKLQEIKPKKSSNSIRKPEPYQPAAVDLSTFSSLTRQPNLSQRTLSNLTLDSALSKLNTTQGQSAPKSAISLNSPVSPQKEKHVPLSTAQTYHNDILINQQQHLNNLNLKIQSQKNPLIDDLSQRRRSQNSSPMALVNKLPSPLTNHQNQFSNQGSSQPQQKQQPQQPQNLINHRNNTSINNTPVTKNQMSAQVVMQPSESEQSYFKLQHIQAQNQHPTQNHVQHLQHKHLQHIKELRSPMYVPAVLRKTVDGETADVPAATFGANRTLSSSASLRSFDSNASANSSSSPLLSPSASAKSFRSYEHFLRQPPTRKHWLKDETVYKCGIPQCPKEFNFFERRHHCRKCGGIFCKEHTSHFLYINHLAQFTTGGRGTLSRVCDNCIKEYNQFMKSQFGIGSKPAENEEVSRPDPNAELIEGQEASIEPQFDFKKLNNQKSFNKFEQDFGNTKPVESEPIVGSVPANWTWSSF